MFKTIFRAAAAALRALAAQAAPALGEVAAAYVSPTIAYQSYSCRELSARSPAGQRLRPPRPPAHRIPQAHEGRGRHDRRPRHLLAGGLLRLRRQWRQAARAGLKGQMQAIEDASIQKKCGISFQRA